MRKRILPIFQKIKSRHWRYKLCFFHFSVELEIDPSCLDGGEKIPVSLFSAEILDDPSGFSESSLV
jgi:hypothetical protein